MLCTLPFDRHTSAWGASPCTSKCAHRMSGPWNNEMMMVASLQPPGLMKMKRGIYVGNMPIDELVGQATQASLCRPAHSGFALTRSFAPV